MTKRALTMKLLNKILYVASSDDNDCAIMKRAMAIAGNNQATLTVIGFVKKAATSAITRRYITSELQSAMVEQRRSELQTRIAGMQPSGLSVDVKVISGRVSVEVIREVLAAQYDAVIKKAEGSDSKLNTFGSTDRKILRNCPCPVWIIKGVEEEGHRDIVAALDYGPDDASIDALNGQIIKMASSLALAEFAELHIVHAWELPYESYLRSRRAALSDSDVDSIAQQERDERKRWFEKLIAKHLVKPDPDVAEFLKPTLHLCKGNARDVVPDLIQELDAELVVMGTVGRVGIPGFIIGNTAETILNRINCSVLAIKPQGFKSPVTI